MKIQHLAIVFVIIILPISMVISYYTGTQIKTIQQQQLYNSRLLTATYDSIRSFQLNTLNNKYASLSDSKIRDIEAAVNTFYSSLSGELGASGFDKETLSDYIPAVLFNLYDGYYVYGKYYNEEIEEYQYFLRPYVYYSCRYKTDNNVYDFTVNYTLDNTITVYGKVGGTYVTKSGALINLQKVKSEQKAKLSTAKKTIKYNEINGKEKEIYVYEGSFEYDNVTISPEILEENLYTSDTDSIKKYQYTVYDNKKIYKGDIGDPRDLDAEGKVKYFWNNQNSKQYITDRKTLAFIGAMTDASGNLCCNSAVEYFYRALEFSTWVDNNLGTITQKNAVDINGNKIEFSTNTGNEYIFKLNREGNDPLVGGSTFNENRVSVIRKSIETNLSVAIANFGGGTGYEYLMPKFSEDDWHKLTNNISVASFMQGMPIGAKVYNDYCIVTNNKNKEFVSEESIYLIENNKKEVHSPGCIALLDSTDNITAFSNIEFERQTATTSIGTYAYYYPHDDARAYECLVNVSQRDELDDIMAGNGAYAKNGKGAKIRKAYLTALARERYNLYKTNNYFGT